MTDLRKRFGRLVAAHRKRQGMTQDALSGATELSVDMISRIEGGTTGASFATVDRLAAALKVDPGQLFTTGDHDASVRPAMVDLTAKLASLNDRDLRWIDQLLDAALKPRS